MELDVINTFVLGTVAIAVLVVAFAVMMMYIDQPSDVKEGDDEPNSTFI